MSMTDRLMEMGRHPPEPPPEAFSNLDAREVDDAWLATVDPEHQLRAMRLWFLARYCDPQMETPYNPETGSYFFLRGGPYDPRLVLMERFEGLADFETIVELGREFLMEVGDEWAPTELTAVDEWDDVFVDTADGPRRRYQERIDDLRALAGIDGAPALGPLLRQLTYAAIITALETYLWELAAYWLEQDLQAIGRLINSQSRLQDRLRTLGGDSDENRAALCAEVHLELKFKVWHRWEKNWPFLRDLLDVEIPPHASFVEATKVRHDIAHRGGKDVDHNIVSLTLAQVEQLIDDVSAFIDELQRRIDCRGVMAD